MPTKKNKKRTMEWTVERPDEKKTLKDFIAEKMGVSRRSAKQHLDARVVWVNGKCVWMDRHAIRRGDVVSVSRAIASPTAISRAVDRKIEIVYEDDDFIVANKPAGMLTNDSDMSVETALRRQTGNPAICAAHRLDRDTTGCLLFAKSQLAKNAAISVFKEHRVQKTYRCITFGRWDADSTTVDLPINDERALTNIKCISANDAASHLVARIETGRTHQIRKHLAMARHPIAGDRQYGLKTIEDPRLRSISRAMLHAVELEMDHPTHPSRKLKVFAPIPADFHATLRLLSLR